MNDMTLVKVLIVREVGGDHEFSLVFDSHTSLDSKSDYEAIGYEVYKHSCLNFENSSFVEREDLLRYRADWSEEQGYPNSTSFRLLSFDYGDESLFDIDLVYGFLIEGNVYPLGKALDVENDDLLNRL